MAEQHGNTAEVTFKAMERGEMLRTIEQALKGRRRLGLGIGAMFTLISQDGRFCATSRELASMAAQHSADHVDHEHKVGRLERYVLAISTLQLFTVTQQRYFLARLNM